MRAVPVPSGNSQAVPTSLRKFGGGTRSQRLGIVPPPAPVFARRPGETGLSQNWEEAGALTFFLEVWGFVWFEPRARYRGVIAGDQ